MILPIISYGNPVLRKKCIEIASDYLHLSQLIDDMYETMYAAKGVGLAAPQVNTLIQLFVIDTTPFAEDKENDIIPLKQVFINPRIIRESGKDWFFNEGCLSIPDIREDISRKESIS